MDKKLAESIIQRLEIPEEYGINSYDEDVDDSFIYEQLPMDLFGHYTIENGVTKIVIIFDELPFVIKIPFNGYWNGTEEYNSETNEYYYDDGEFIYFENASEDDEGDPEDYCLNELNKTDAMIAAGFGCLVPKMEYVCHDSNYRAFYIQEKVNTFYDCEDEYTPSAESLKTAKEKFSSINSIWLGRIFDLYGEEFWEDFLEWNNNCPFDILSDMHTGNIGYTEDGAPVMLDISGWRDDF